MEETCERVTNEPKERPAFLTTLCVLTFASSPLLLTLLGEGWWLLQDSIRSMEEAMGGIKELAEANPEMNSMYESAMSGVKMTGITVLVNAAFVVISFAGSLQMWKLRRSGFYIYLTGEISPVIISAITLSNSQLGSTYFYLIPIIAVSAITMTVLYAMNLRHLS